MYSCICSLLSVLAGLINCTWCAPGKYQTGLGVTAEVNCTLCAAGEFQAGLLGVYLHCVSLERIKLDYSVCFHISYRHFQSCFMSTFTALYQAQVNLSQMHARLKPREKVMHECDSFVWNPKMTSLGTSPARSSRKET